MYMENNQRSLIYLLSFHYDRKIYFENDRRNCPRKYSRKCENEKKKNSSAQTKRTSCIVVCFFAIH